jgi:CBS domain-containing protein
MPQKTLPLARLTADDLMSRDLLLLSEDTPLRSAAHLLIRHQVSGAPVIDRYGKFVGVLSALDFVRVVNDTKREEEQSAPNPLACRFQVSRTEFGDRVLCTLPAGACAVQQVQTDAAGCKWIACSQPHEMFVDWQVADVERLPTEAVGRFMTRNTVTVQPTASVREMARLMVDAHIHRLVVTDESNSPVGIVSSTDILGAVARSMELDALTN